MGDDKPQCRRTWRRAARSEAIRRLDLQRLRERAVQIRVVDDDTISDSDIEYNNLNDVNGSNDVESEDFSLHDALIGEDNDFNEGSELCNSEGNDDANIIGNENMEIDQVNIENNLVINNAQINAYVLKKLKEWGKSGVTGQKINELLSFKVMKIRIDFSLQRK